jgi:hypothetical protein
MVRSIQRIRTYLTRSKSDFDRIFDAVGAVPFEVDSHDQMRRGLVKVVPQESASNLTYAFDSHMHAEPVLT